MSASPAERLRQEGLLASDRAVARVTERFGVAGSADSGRVWEAVVAGGLRFDVLADRGFDIGAAEFAGIPLSWTSPVADHRALSVPSGDDWLSRFTGGLIVTCGMRDIGRGRGRPLHGDVSHRPASGIRVTPSRGSSEVRLDADIEDESLFGPSLRLERTIVSSVDRHEHASLTIEDRVVNTGRLPAPIEMLYHLNFGAPLFVPGTRVVSDATSMTPRDAISDRFDPRTIGDPVDDIVESVHEHRDATSVRILSPRGLAVSVAWSAATLPHLHQWMMPARGRWALGIEPATRSLLADSSPGEAAVMLGPGEHRDHSVRVTVQRSTSAD